MFCRTEGGDIYLGQVWPGNTAFPDFVTEEARTWWGELNAAHVRSGLAGIWNDMNEPATGNIPAAPMRFGHGEFPHERYPQPVRPADGHGHHRRAAGGDAGAADLRALPGRFRRHPAVRGELDGRQPGPLGPPAAEHRHGRRASACPARPSSAPTSAASRATPTPELFLRWMQYGVLTPFCRNHSEIGNVDQYAWSFGDVIGRARADRGHSCATGCCPTCTPAS